MWVGILGPVRVAVGGRDVDVGASKERAVLATLALRAGAPVAADLLLESLWGDRPPPTAHRTLGTHVARLRGVLGAATIVTVDDGFRLDLAPGSVDSFRFEQLISEGRDAARRSDPAAARARFGEALDLWRGEPLTDFADAPPRWGQTMRLHELRFEARHGRIAADLELGRHESVVGELETLVVDEPLREPYWEQLVLALYRSDRQVDALRAMRRVRERLAEEVGAEPSPALQRLEWQVLNQDPQLDVTAPERTTVLPAPVDSFVGRPAEVDALDDAVREKRLITLHGPGGVGKSRLALEVARRLTPRFPDGVHWVDVTPVTSTDEAVARLAEAFSVTSVPGRPLADVLTERLRHRDTLIVMDNCEQAAPALGRVCTRLLRSAPNVRVLATSRAVLGADGEHCVELAPLSVAAPGSDVESALTAEAVQLFEERRADRDAAAADDDLADVVELTRRLDGLPLAVELAAAQSRHLSPRQIADRLEEHSRLPGSAVADVAPEHHRTMMQAIEWSHRLLDPDAQHLFELLAVMPGDFDLGAAEAVGSVAGFDTDKVLVELGRLLDSSVVGLHHRTGGRRYVILLVLRQFALERLSKRGERDLAERAHADHFRSFAVEAGRSIDGPDAGRWWARVRTEREHVRAAVRWSLEHDDRTTTLEFARLLARTFETTVSSDFGEVVDRFRSMLDGADDAPAALRGWAWQGMVTAAWLSGDPDLAIRATESSMTLFSEAPDREGLATARWNHAAALLLGLGDTTSAKELDATAAEDARETGLRALEALAISGQVQSMIFADEPLDTIEPLMIRGEGLADPALPLLQAHLSMNRCYFHWRAGELDDAAAAAEAARAHSEAGGSSVYEQIGLVGLGVVAASRGDAATARGHLLHAVQVAIDVSNEVQMGVAILALASVLDADGDAVGAARLWGAGTARTAVWPFISRLDPSSARATLGDRFSVEEEIGRTLVPRQVLDVAIG